MKENLFDKAFMAVTEGAKFQVDFKNRSLKIDGQYWVKNGETDLDLDMLGGSSEDFLLHLEENFRIYSHSVPSERSEGKRRRYFNALPEWELSDEDMMYGIPREVAQAQLELYVLCRILQGLKWDESWGKWFWQSKNEPDLVLLREWFG